MENQHGINYEAMDNDESYVPRHMRGGVQRYIEHGISMGGFGTALVSNNLKEAIGRADLENKKHITSTVAWFYSYAPSKCWGSSEAVETWKGIGKTE